MLKHAKSQEVVSLCKESTQCTRIRLEDKFLSFCNLVFASVECVDLFVCACI